MKKPITTAAVLLTAATIFSSYTGEPREVITAAPVRTSNASAWKNLFDGKTLEGWHGFNKQGPVANWVVEDGVLLCQGIAKDASGGDLVTDEEFENFELSWEWKISTGGNSGLMYHVTEGPKYSAPYETGPEYQLIDDTGYPGELEESQLTGSDYGMSPASSRKQMKPAGEWNTSRVIFNKGHVEHWLNGKKILEFQAWGEDWMKLKNEGKWKDYLDYGKAKKGKIALQDHGDKAWFRNIRIRTL